MRRVKAIDPGFDNGDQYEFPLDLNGVPCLDLPPWLRNQAPVRSDPNALALDQLAGLSAAGIIIDDLDLYHDNDN